MPILKRAYFLREGYEVGLTAIKNIGWGGVLDVEDYRSSTLFTLCFQAFPDRWFQFIFHSGGVQPRADAFEDSAVVDFLHSYAFYAFVGEAPFHLSRYPIIFYGDVDVDVGRGIQLPRCLEDFEEML